MSEGDVENVSGYEVLPKEVLAEVGSVKLFSGRKFLVAPLEMVEGQCTSHSHRCILFRARLT